MTIIANKKTKDTGTLKSKKKEVKFNSLQLKHFTCTKVLREEIEKKLPGLNSPKTAKGRTSYWTMLLYLLAGARTPEDETDSFKSNKLLLGWKIISRIEHGYVVNPKDSKSTKFLEAFLQDVFDGNRNAFDWYECNKEEGRARTLKTFKLDPKLQALYDQERSQKRWVKNERVYFVDATQYSRRKSKKIQDEYKLEAITNIHNLPESMQEVLLKLNQQPINCFNSLCEYNYTYAQETALQLTVKKPKTINSYYKNAIECNLDCLYSIPSAPQPVYTATDTPGSTRIQTYGQNLTRLSRPVRAAYLRGTYNCDLASIQLAIAAKILNVKSILDFLHTGQSFWTLILDYLDIEEEMRPAVKSVIKKALYSILFGMKSSNVQYNLTCSFKDKSYGEKFISHPMIAELVKAMDAKRQEIKQDGYYIDAFDRKITDFKNSKSALALLIQSWESRIMQSLYASEFKDNQAKYKFIVVAHLHDGVYLKFNTQNKSIINTYIEQIRCIIHNRLEELQIPSKFDCQEVTDETVETLLKANKLEADIHKYGIPYIENSFYDLDGNEDEDWLIELEDEVKQQELLFIEPPKIVAQSIIEEPIAQQEQIMPPVEYLSALDEQQQQLKSVSPKPKFKEIRHKFIYSSTEEWNVIEESIKDGILIRTVETWFPQAEVSLRGYL